MNGIVCKEIVLRTCENLESNLEYPGMSEIIKINLMIKIDLVGCVMMILDGFTLLTVCRM